MGSEMCIRDSFYGLPLNNDFITLERQPTTVPDTLDAGDTTLVPFHAGETLAWRITE